MRIAVDYDGTFTADPVLWLTFMIDARKQGHDVFIVTIRNDLLDADEVLLKVAGNFPVYYTRGVAKRWWCLHHGPGTVDVWIDDTPESILENSPLTPEEIADWRAKKAKRSVAHSVCRDCGMQVPHGSGHHCHPNKEPIPS